MPQTRLVNSGKRFRILMAVLVVSFLSVCSCGNIGCTSKVEPMTRDTMIEIADSYATHQWYPTDDNIFHGQGSGKIINTPDRDTNADFKEYQGWKANQLNIGVPYQWGGFSSLSGLNLVNPMDFDDQYKGEGNFNNDIKYAGDIECTGSRGSSSACGVDCSGFVSRCWNLSKKQSTKSLTNSRYSHPITFDQLMSGDILIIPGHVMLFKEFSNPDRTVIKVYEVSDKDWKVSEREYVMESISSNNYSITLVGEGTFDLYQYNEIIN